MVKYVELDIFIYSKASSIAFASAENIVASSGKINLIKIRSFDPLLIDHY